MLRPATPPSLGRLRRAAHDTDRELDAALLRLGVLAPLELAPIRRLLTAEGVRLVAGANADGHRIIEFVNAHGLVARLHHDGSVTDVHRARAATSA